LASVFTILLVFLIVIVPLLLSIAVLSQEVLKLSESLKNYFQNGNLNLLIEDIRNKLMFLIYKYQLKYPFLQSILTEENIKKFLIEAYTYITSSLTEWTKIAIIQTVNFVFGLFIYLMTLFFALYSGDRALVHFKRILPLEEKDKEEVFDTLYRAITGVIYGTVGTAVLQAFCALALYIYYGLPYPFLWALATALFSFIPPLGTAYVWLPVTLYVFLKVSAVKAVTGLIYALLVIASVDNLVRPFFMKEKIELPYVLLFFSVIGGLLTFGFAGLFLGPTIFALFLTLIKLYEEKFS
jgi:predicted PurR-regulated permease PerM